MKASEEIWSRAVGMGGLGLLAVGLAMTVWTTREIAAVGDRMRVKLGDWERLEEIRRMAERSAAAKGAFEALPAKRPAPLMETVKAVAGKYPMEEPRETRRPLEDGWTARECEVSFPEIPLEKAMEAAARAEEGRPPWRLSGCVIRASPRGAGVGRVVLTFEALEKP